MISVVAHGYKPRARAPNWSRNLLCLPAGGLLDLDVPNGARQALPGGPGSLMPLSGQHYLLAAVNRTPAPTPPASAFEESAFRGLADPDPEAGPPR